MKKCLFFILIMAFSFSIKAVDFKNIYITGNAMPCGWTNSEAETMTLSNEQEGIFIWRGKVNIGEFKFLLEPGHWTNCLNASTDKEVILFNAEHTLNHVPNYFENGYDYPFRFDQEEFVIITVYTKEMKMVVKPETERELPAELWITGSAVPGNIAQLTEDPSLAKGYFRYNGKLQAGEFKIIDTQSVNAATNYYLPALEDANVAEFSSMYITKDNNAPGWNVTIPDDYYKVKVNAVTNSLKGEMFIAREELFIVGGATEIGWDSGLAIRLEKDYNNPNIFTFKGELNEAKDGDDRDKFKLLGQNNWGPVSFHPKSSVESLLDSKYIHENLSGDHKWAIDLSKQGEYIITVDLLNETIDAKYTKDTSVDKNVNDKNFIIISENGSVVVKSQNNKRFDYARLIDCNGKTINSSKKPNSEFSIGKNLKKGVYLLELSQNNKVSVNKVLINQ